MASRSPYDSKIWLKNYDKHVPHDIPEPNVPSTQILDDAAKLATRKP
nr:hypothetical protein [Candidatus Njordarchaeota archaeon]